MITVSVQKSEPRAFAAVRARLPVDRVPASFRMYLDQVYAAAKSGLVSLDGQNIFVYRGGFGPHAEVDAEFGVGLRAPFTSAGNVLASSLPVGEVATATHWGDYAGIGAAHDSVIAWCRANGRRLTGTRWEVYGHWTDDPSQLRTDVYHLLE